MYPQRVASHHLVILDVAEIEAIRDLDPVSVRVTRTIQTQPRHSGYAIERFRPWPGWREITGSDEANYDYKNQRKQRSE